MVDYIKSKSIKEYYEQEGAVLPDFYKAELILRSDYPVKMIHESLRELAEITDDEKLKEVIPEIIERQCSEIRSIRDNSSQSAVYRLEVYEPDEDRYTDTGCYASFNAAESRARSCSEKHIIRKLKLFGEDDAEKNFKEEQEHPQMELGAMLIDKDGNILRCLSALDECKFRGGKEGEAWSERCLVMKHPFRTGDIVKNIATGDTGVVNDNRISDDEMWKNKCFLRCGSRSDLWITVECIDPSGSFWAVLSCPHNLEFAEEPKAGRECSTKWKLLKEASRLVKGEGSLDSFTDYKAVLEAECRYN